MHIYDPGIINSLIRFFETILFVEEKKVFYFSFWVTPSSTQRLPLLEKHEVLVVEHRLMQAKHVLQLSISSNQHIMLRIMDKLKVDTA